MNQMNLEPVAIPTETVEMGLAQRPTPPPVTTAAEEATMEMILTQRPTPPPVTTAAEEATTEMTLTTAPTPSQQSLKSANPAMTAAEEVTTTITTGSMETEIPTVPTESTMEMEAVERIMDRKVQVIPTATLEATTEEATAEGGTTTITTGSMATEIPTVPSKSTTEMEAVERIMDRKVPVIPTATQEATTVTVKGTVTKISAVYYHRSNMSRA
mmetsp:Transcript_24779/g.49311  ORF Transcript_24779/g.49311 Transcript_24779/m.49311 type:complete len:214 (-) Transcript_24779:424-1065(-)